MAGKPKPVDRKKLAAAVRESTSYRQVGNRMGMGNQTAKAAIERLGINTDHFDFGRRSFNRVGETYNYLTMREVFKKDSGRWFCRCDCQCGTTGTVKRLDGVMSGHIPSCGCAFLKRPSMLGENNPAYTGCGELSGSRIYWIKEGAKRRGLAFKVTKKYLWDLFESQGRRCALSGVQLVFGSRHSHETTASLDRIDSSKGYLVGNVQWVHKDVNQIKRDLDQEYFLTLCGMISKHRKLASP